MIFGIPLFAAILVASVVSAQEYKVPVENTKDGRLVLSDFTGDLPIEGYNGKEIIITGDAVSTQAPERAKGLKPVYSGGTDNTGIGLLVEKSGNKVTVKCLLPFTRHGDYKIKVPDNLALEITNSCERSSDISVKDMKNEIEIKTCHSINLKNVTGPLVLSTISGNIDVTFSEVSRDKPFSIASISGEVDITLPVKAAVNLEMKSLSGTIYSDFDFPAGDKEMKRVGGSTVKSSLNGGGVDFKIESISGNVYLRKG